MTTLAEASFSPLPAATVATLGHMLEAAVTSDTPALLVSPLAVTANFRRIQAAFPHAEVLYAIKANPHPSVTSALIAAGCGLDVASGAEVALARALQADPVAICFSAPFKRGRDIAAAHALGIRLYVADSPGEVINIARHAPGAGLLLRVAVTGGNALTPMGRKFGANGADVPALAHLARQHGLVVEGLHFHVGSQCIDTLAWSRAVGECAPLWHTLRDQDFPLHVIDIGGGFPVRYDQPVPTIEEIAHPTLAAIRVWMGPEVTIALEPGRWMTQDAAVLVTEVIGTARRGEEEWVYLDAGVYNGLIDTSEGVVYPLCTADEVLSGRPRPRRRVTLAGPSCDGNDVLMRGASVPAVEIGDRLLFAQAGAYTTAFERFNGLSFPEVVELGA